MLTVADMLTTALTWHAAGYSVIPIKGDGSKQPALDTWRAYMDRQPDEMEVARWGRTYSGMGVVCGGPMSLEMLEVEGYGLYTAPIVRALMEDNDLGEVWDRIMSGYLERSPRGGLHWFYRISDGPARGNTKLARRPDPDHPGKVQVLWETRGQGGQTIIAPSGGGTSRDGEWAVVRGTVNDIPTVTVDERDAIYSVLAMVDEMPAADPGPIEHGGMFASDTDGLRPGDDYNQRTTWDDILIPRGWARVRRMGSGWTWRRPGKTDPGISATTGQSKDGVERLYVFSTSTEFEDGRPYSKFAAYALLEHRGDWSAAGRALYAAGYGTRRERRAVPAGAPPADPTPDDDTPDEQFPSVALFDATPTLEHIRAAARARMVSPWALLGSVLARVVAEVRPCVALPATVGSRASLNLYVGLVGPSGAAKTSAVAVADDLLLIGGPVAKVQGSGSGEGLIASYLRKNPDRDDHELLYVLRDNPHVCIVIDEINMLGQIQGRNGSTLAPILRSGWSGSALETINADPTRRRVVPKMAYRLTAVAGIQPLAADVLFNDADTGTPQRWLWLPALDPEMPDEAPDWPGSLAWSAPSLIGWQHHGLVNIRLPQHVTDGIREAHRERHRKPDANHLDGHLTLTRLKVAAALAILHGGYEVTDLTWDLAGQVMAISVAVRGQCQQAIGSEAARRAETRGKLEHARDLGRAEAVADTARRDAQRVWQQVHRHTGDEPGSSRAHAAEKGCSGRCVTLALTRRTAEQKEEAVAYAVAMSWVTRDPEGRLHGGTSQPAEMTP